mgnify:CR=1 FL=1
MEAVAAEPKLVPPLYFSARKMRSCEHASNWLSCMMGKTDNRTKHSATSAANSISGSSLSPPTLSSAGQPVSALRPHLRILAALVGIRLDVRKLSL